jgi:hypothetical protein
MIEMITMYINSLISWIVSRLKERTTWDGAVMIAAGVAYLIFEPIAAIAAYIAIAYGAWTIWKKENL